jgi:predicted transposase YdaD
LRIQSTTAKFKTLTLKHPLGNLRSYLVEILRSATNLPMDAEHRAFLSKLLEYIIEGCKDIEEQDVEQALLSIGSREAREAYMTLAERLIEKGKAEGRLEGRQEDLLNLLTQKFGAVADADKSKIMGTRDLDRLDQALGLIFKTKTIAEVLRPLD